MKSTPVNEKLTDKIIKYAFHREYDTDFNHLDDKDVLEKVNIKPIGDYIPALRCKTSYR